MIFDMTKRKSGGGEQGYTLYDIISGAEPHGDIDTSEWDIDIKPYAFYKTPITSYRHRSAHNVGEYVCGGCKNLVTAFIMAKVGGSSVVRNCTELTTLIYNAPGNYSNVATGCTKLAVADMGVNISYLGVQYFSGCQNLKTLILRSTLRLTAIGQINAFSDTPFGSGGTGGTIYIPKELYDHLGDGTSKDYKAATNWSTLDGYGTITWKSIESTHTDPHAPIDLTLYYADGTPIQTT